MFTGWFYGGNNRRVITRAKNPLIYWPVVGLILLLGLALALYGVYLFANADHHPDIHSSNFSEPLQLCG